MRPRSLYLATFLAGAAVIAFLAVGRSFRPAPASPAATPAPVPANIPDPPRPVPATANPLFARLLALLAAPDARPREATLTFRDEAAYRRFLARAASAGLNVIGRLDALKTVRVGFTTIAAVQQDLVDHASDYADAAANNVLRIPEIPAKADRADVPQVPLRNTTLAFLGADGDRTAWGRGITIAILDSGINALDPTFSGRVRTIDVGAGSLPGTGDSSGHGTGVAALAAGISADAPGVAPAANLLGIRVTDNDGLGDIFTVAQAIVAAVDAGARVINISLGGYATGNVLSAAIAYAADRGAVIVAAAGNDQLARLAWPAADVRVVSVGAVDAAGQQVSFSNSDAQLAISAPGYGVQTAWLDQRRVYVDGTSASSPLVAGAIAAVMSANPALTARQAWDVIAASTSDAGAPGPDADYGRGILNLGWAMSRNDPARVDPALSAHHYDGAHSRMDFIVQNRGAQSLSGLTLDVDTNGVTTTYRVPALAAGASGVITASVDQKTLSATGSIKYITTLNAPIGIVDQDPSNNIRISRLTPPKK